MSDLETMAPSMGDLRPFENKDGAFDVKVFYNGEWNNIAYGFKTKQDAQSAIHMLCNPSIPINNFGFGLGALIKKDIEIHTYELREPFLLVNYNTGITFESQVGGMYNNHEKLEGFILPLHFRLVELIQAFNDCDYVCYGGSGEGAITLNGSHKETCAKLIQKIIDEYHELVGEDPIDFLHFGVTNLKFDFDRIDKLQEAYWPVSFEIDKVPLTGYIVKENCD